MPHQTSSAENAYMTGASSSHSRSTESSSQLSDNAFSSGPRPPRVRLPLSSEEPSMIPMPTSASDSNAEPEEHLTAETTGSDTYETASECDHYDAAAINVSARPEQATYDCKPWHPISQDVKKSVSLLSGPSVTVIVGPEQTTYTVPMALLFHFSDYAMKALTSNFSEGCEASSSILTLPGTDPRAFAMLIMYMHQGQLCIRKFCRKTSLASLSDRYDELTESCLLLCRFYIMMDFLQSRYWPRVQTDALMQLENVMDDARKMNSSSPVLPDTFLEVMRAVSPESRLALLIRLDLQAEFAKPVHRPAMQYAQCAREFPKEFLTIFDKVVDGLQWGHCKIGMGNLNAGTDE